MSGDQSTDLVPTSDDAIYGGESQVGDDTSGIELTDGRTTGYRGQYKFGDFNGFGTFLWSCGTRYHGQWRGGDRIGLGELSYLDGRRYQGEWLWNTRHGRGVMTHSDVTTFRGEFKRDKGVRGTFTSSDRQQSLCQFDDAGHDVRAARIRGAVRV